MRPRLIRLCVAVLAVAGFLTLSPRASADTIGSITLTYNSGSNGNGLNGGGAFHWTESAPINGASVTTYCIDVQDSIKTSGSSTFTTHTDLTKAPTIANNNPGGVGAINALYTHYYNTSLTSSTLQAAFQLALWDLVYGASNPTLTGYLATIPYNSTVAADATKMLNNTLTETQPELSNFSLIALVDSAGGSPGTKNRNQDQIMVVPNPPVKGVPAPPAVMLAGIGMLALFGRARWNRKANPTV